MHAYTGLYADDSIRVYTALLPFTLL